MEKNPIENKEKSSDLKKSKFLDK